MATIKIALQFQLWTFFSDLHESKFIIFLHELQQWHYLLLLIHHAAWIQFLKTCSKKVKENGCIKSFVKLFRWEILKFFKKNLNNYYEFSSSPWQHDCNYILWNHFNMAEISFEKWFVPSILKLAFYASQIDNTFSLLWKFLALPKPVWPLMLFGADIISKFMDWKAFLENFLQRKVNDWLKSPEWEMRHAYFRWAQISNCVSLHRTLEVVDGLFNFYFSADILLFLVLN